MVARRYFLQGTLQYAAMFSMGLVGGSLLSPRVLANNIPVTWSMPDEGEPHKKTWMAFVANDYIWSRQQIPEVKKNLALIAATIAQYEPVSMLVAPSDYDEAFQLLGGLNTHNYPIELVECMVDDLWLRDTGPTFIKGSDGHKYAINFNFNGWGNKQTHTYDAKVAHFISQQSHARIKTTPLSA